MKKILALLLTFVLFLTACTGSHPLTAFDTYSPWTHGETLVYAVEHYSVAVQNGVDVEDSKLVLATGRQTVTTLREGQYYIITTEWYLDFECADDGITVRDEITTFIRMSDIGRRFHPVESRREVIVRRKTDGNNFLRGDINPNLSHTIETNYSALISIFTPHGGTAQSQNIRRGSDVFFDNESLFFIVRAFDTLGGQIQRFNLNNMFDFHRNSIIAHPMVVTPMTENQSRTIINSDNFVATEHTPIHNNQISTHAVRIGIDGSRSGQPIHAWYAINDYYYDGNTARKLLVEYMTYTVIFATNVQTRIRYRLESVSWV